MVGELMEREGVQFLHPASPLSFTSHQAAITSPPPDGKEVRTGVWELTLYHPHYPSAAVC